jgi:DUF1009 family protein
MDGAPIGLLAGWGQFPLVFAAKARGLGRRVVTLGLRYEASAELKALSERFRWSAIVRIGGIIRYFRRAGVREVVMAGKIHKANYMYRPWRWFTFVPDWTSLRLWFSRSRRDNRDDSLTLTVVEEFARHGLTITSPLDLCPELLVPAGTLTRRQPTAAEEADIRFGWELAKEMGRLDVGQSVAVKERAVLAVEAIEGTDQAILRAGTLCRKGGFVVVKVSKPQQDRRFDVPTIGCGTIETLHQAGGKVLAIEADNTIVLDQEKVVALADRYGISVVAVAA